MYLQIFNKFVFHFEVPVIFLKMKILPRRLFGIGLIKIYLIESIVPVFKNCYKVLYHSTLLGTRKVMQTRAMLWFFFKLLEIFFLFPQSFISLIRLFKRFVHWCLFPLYFIIGNFFFEHSGSSACNVHGSMGRPQYKHSFTAIRNQICFRTWAIGKYRNNFNVHNA